MSAPSLAPLAEARSALLLAEIGALLHNVGKLSEEFLGSQTETGGVKDSSGFSFREIVGIVQNLVDTGLFAEGITRFAVTGNKSINQQFLKGVVKPLLQERTLTLPPPLDDHGYAIGDFIQFQAHKWYDPEQTPVRITEIWPSSWATFLLEQAHHGASWGDKAGRVALTKQVYDDVRLATAFGYETIVAKNELASLRQKLLNTVVTTIEGIKRDAKNAEFTTRHRTDLFNEARSALSAGLGDTQRPINDVTVWDLGASAAALFKAGAAGLILDPPVAMTDAVLREMRWRHLSVRFDGLAYLGRVHHVTDLLGRRALMQQALDKVRDELEVTYPLGNEVYRDENGSVFVVPDRNDLCQATIPQKDGGTVDLARHLTGLFDNAGKTPLPLDGEVAMAPELSGESWPGVELTLKTALATPLAPLTARPEQVRGWWAEARNAEVCTVCQLRPQGYGAPSRVQTDKAIGRNVCWVCLQRRGERSREWATSGLTGPTIWTDEVADINGRVALIAARFDLDDWLSGDLVQTLAVDIDPSDDRPIPKQPSFARVRRVWETTQRFWQDTEKGLRQLVGVGGPRLTIEGKVTLEPGQLLGLFPVYDLDLGERTLSAVWDSRCNRFISADNLCYLEKQLRPSADAWRSPAEAAEAVAKLLQGRPIKFAERGGYNTLPKPVGTLAEASAELVLAPYVPAIPILAEPRTFMALVPAMKAMQVAEKIAADYAEQMGRVRNRLRLDVGVIFFPRRTPLPAVLDAGRRLLSMPNAPALWEAICVKDRSEEGRVAVGFAEGAMWDFQTTMGDGTPSATRDDWYPYFTRVTTAGDTPTVELVHVTDLQSGDRVEVRPSHFDYEVLETPAQRLRLDYDDDGRRHDPDRRHRPYLLEEVVDLARLWRLLPGNATDSSKPATTQIHALVGAIEAKRRSWGVPMGSEADDPRYATFARLVGDALAQTGSGWWPALNDGERSLLKRAAVRGWLADVMEINLGLEARPGAAASVSEAEPVSSL